jgi:hypothetical protein
MSRLVRCDRCGTLGNVVKLDRLPEGWGYCTIFDDSQEMCPPCIEALKDFAAFRPANKTAEVRP